MQCMQFLRIISCYSCHTTIISDPSVPCVPMLWGRKGQKGHILSEYFSIPPLKVPMKKMAPLLVSSMRYTKGVSQ